MIAVGLLALLMVSMGLYAWTQVGLAAGWVAYCFTGAGVVS